MDIDAMFNVVMIVLFVSIADQSVTKINEIPMPTLEICEQYARQKQYTEMPTNRGFNVYVCELR